MFSSYDDNHCTTGTSCTTGLHIPVYSYQECYFVPRLTSGFRYPIVISQRFNSDQILLSLKMIEPQPPPSSIYSPYEHFKEYNRDLIISGLEINMTSWLIGSDFCDHPSSSANAEFECCWSKSKYCISGFVWYFLGWFDLCLTISTKIVDRLFFSKNTDTTGR